MLRYYKQTGITERKVVLNTPLPVTMSAEQIVDGFSNNKPLISIVLPTLNGSRYIATSIDSCLQQSYPNFELIVVVDGRTRDNTMQIVREYSDPRIRIFENRSGDGGLPGSLNIGFSHARGDFYTWTSDDNYYQQDALEVMFAYLVQNSEVGLVYTGYWYIDDDGRILRESDLLPPQTVTRSNPVGCCFLYRRDVAEKAGQYDVNFRMVEDAEFWMRIFKLSKIAMIEGRYYYYRLHNDSLTVKNYGAHFAKRRLVAASKTHFGINWFAYQRLIAEVFIDEAFFAFNKMDYRHVLACLLSGVVRNPLWLGNRGLYSIGIQSLFKSIWSN